MVNFDKALVECDEKYTANNICLHCDEFKRCMV